MSAKTLTPAQVSAIEHYAAWHERLGDAQQLAVLHGDFDEAERCHQAARIALSAWQQEINPREHEE